MRQKGEKLVGDIVQRFNEMIFTFADNNMAEFARQIGIPRSTIYNITGGKLNHPSFEILAKIIYAFPQVSPDWLILGKGDMRRATTSESVTNTINLSAADRLRIDKLLLEIEQLRANMALTK